MTYREILMKKLSSYQFMAADLKLYLDTHPNDKGTLDKLKEYTEKYMKERERFEKLYGGPDGELGASLRYLSQRFTMPLPELKATLTDIGTEAPALDKLLRLSGY